MNIAHKLYYLRKAHDLNQADLAKIAGVSIPAVSIWESGKNVPRAEYVKKICDYFGIDMAKFLDPESDVYDADLPENVFPIPGSTRIPLLGEICAGTGIIANPETQEYVFAPEWVHADLALRCRGDSMINARIFDGDMVYVRKQDVVENGEIAAVEIGEEAVLKRVFFSGNNVILQSENNAYMPIIVPLQAFENGEAHVIGKAVAFTSMLR